MSEKTYFNLHTQGIAYLNRARQVRPRKGQSFWAVEVNALHGDVDEIEYTRIDCRVTGQEAQDVIQRLEPEINDRERKVLARFKVGDIYPELFVYRSGQRAGEYGVTIKGRLLRLEWVRLDGEEVHRATPNAETEQHVPDASKGDAATPVPDQKDEAASAAEAQSREPEAQEGAEAGVVQLSKDDPRFQEKKERLKKLGYRFDPKRRAWFKPAEPATA